jgi:hypothetical protein
MSKEKIIECINDFNDKKRLHDCAQEMLDYLIDSIKDSIDSNFISKEILFSVYKKEIEIIEKATGRKIEEIINE